MPVAIYYAKLAAAEYARAGRPPAEREEKILKNPVYL